jgi:hypothetical protein
MLLKFNSALVESGHRKIHGPEKRTIADEAIAAARAARCRWRIVDEFGLIHQRAVMYTETGLQPESDSQFKVRISQ